MIDQQSIRTLVRLALQEDIGSGDATAMAIPLARRARARLIAKQDIVLSGLELVKIVLEEFCSDAQILQTRQDGELLQKNETLLVLEGCARDLLTTERTILNFLQRTCGIATYAKKHRDILNDHPMQILDTRKTTPGFRYWEKKAVRDGGLKNQRMRLDDGILIKENHIRAAGSISEAIKNLGTISLPLQVEVTSWQEAKEAIDNGVFRLLLDNFSPAALKGLVPRLREYKQGLFLEASGGIQYETLKDFASTGVDAVSIGALTHSVPAADLSLLFDFH